MENIITTNADIVPVMVLVAIKMVKIMAKNIKGISVLESF